MTRRIINIFAVLLVVAWLGASLAGLKWSILGQQAIAEKYLRPALKAYGGNEFCPSSEGTHFGPALPGKTPVGLYKARWERMLLSGAHFADLCGGVYGTAPQGLYVKAFDGRYFVVDFTGNDDPLTYREIYWVEISPSIKSGCGRALQPSSTPPAFCVLQERVMTWEQSKDFLRQVTLRQGHNHETNKEREVRLMHKSDLEVWLANLERIIAPT